MLETLVPSRIRRTLFEYLLTHSRERFYLRGLAKELGVSVSPLRRELKRLEQMGMLKAHQEANIRFYVVNEASLEFQQLQQAGNQRGQTPLVSVVSDPVLLEPSALSLERSAFWTNPLRTPVMIGVAGIGMAVLLSGAGLFYLTMTNRQLSTMAQHALRIHEASVARSLTPAAPPMQSAPSPAGSGVMRSSRWQIVPGGFGGLSPGTPSEEPMEGDT